MGRRPTVTDEELLEHARAVFVAQGIRATTAEVAERAGVSEALLFKRFGTKDRLFRHAMRAPFDPDNVAWVTSLEGRVGEGRVREQMVEIGVEVLRFLRTLVPLIAMSWQNMSDAEQAREHRRGDSPPFEARRRLEAYFEAERRLGRIRDVDTEVLARVFMGALFSFATWDVMLGGFDRRPLPPETYVRGLVDMLWDGIAPSETQ